jgi:cell growth-regulating nucleolar protein
MKMPGQSTALAVVDAPPRAPSPPPMAVNVWQYLNPPSPLPTPSDSDWEDEDDMKLDKPASSKSTVASYQTNGYTYGSGPVPSAIARFDSFYGKSDDKDGTSAFETPAPRKTRNGKQAVIETSSSLVKRSTKRKRAHVDDLDLSKSGPSDVVMKDAAKDTPAAHSGLTGGIKGLWSRAFPSPEDIGPSSPVKRSRADPGRRERRVRRKSDSDREKEDRKRKKHKSSDESKTKDKKHERRTSRKRSRSPGVTKQRALSLSPANGHPQKKQMKSIEYHQETEDLSRALVPTKKHEVHHAPTTKSVDTFLSCLVKGAEKEEGVSFQKALQRWNRQGGSRNLEKELWKELKVRCNDNGELVICI